MYSKLTDIEREVANVRWEICKACDTRVPGQNRCQPPWKGGCGCFLHSDKPLLIPLKTEIMRAKCPQGNW